MAAKLGGRNFLSMADLTREEILAVLDTAAELKANRPGEPVFAGKAMAMIFQKPSLRTRVSFERGFGELGGQPIVLGPQEIGLGKRETIEDVALNLSRFVDVIMARVFGHEQVEELARWASVPVINALSAHEHPCQALADLFTIRERRGDLEGLKMVFIGDGNNVAHSLMLAGALVGMHVTVTCPPEYIPENEVFEQARKIGEETGARIETAHDMKPCEGADVIYTDVWTSMGQEEESKKRRKDFEGFRVDESVRQMAADDAVLMHCLPAHYDEELCYETSRKPWSALFDQAENRMHAQKALLVHILT